MCCLTCRRKGKPEVKIIRKDDVGGLVVRQFVEFV